MATIDTLAYSKKLEAAGVGRQQAEAFAEAFVKFVIPAANSGLDFDAIGYARYLIASGVDKNQAKTHAEAILEFVIPGLAKRR